MNKIPAKQQFQLEGLSLWLLIGLFGVGFSLLALNQHRTFQTYGFDLGNVNQAIWNTSQGRFFAFTNMAPVDNRLALHVEPILLLFVPFYWLGLGGPTLLLIAQASIFALGAWPLYQLSKPQLGWGALILALGYLLYPAMEGAVLADFHAVTLAPTFYLFAFYWFVQAEANRPRAMIYAVISLVLAGACKEEMGLTIGMIGLYLWWRHRHWHPGGWIAVLGPTWTALCLLVIQPAFAQGGNIHTSRYTWVLEALQRPSTLFPALIQHAEQVNLPAYLGGMFSPTLGLAALSPMLLLPTLPTLAVNWLSDTAFTWRLEDFHYGAPLAPFIFLATAHTLARWRQWLQTTPHLARWPQIRLWGFNATLLAVLAASLSYHHLRGFTPLAQGFHWRPVTAHHQLGHQLSEEIAPETPLFAPLALNPHVSSRRILHQEFDQIGPQDWLWLDIGRLPNENGIHYFVKDTLWPNYAPVHAEAGYLLLQPASGNNNQTGQLPDRFFDFARAQQEPGHAMQAQFGSALVLLGYDLIFERAEEVQVRSYWQVNAALPDHLYPVLYLLDEQGRPLGATNPNQPPATLVWYPSNQWQIGETVVVDFNYVPWHTRQMSTHRLALGVTTSLDPWDTGARRVPQGQSSPYVMRVAAENTLLEIAHLRRVWGIVHGGPIQRQLQAEDLGQTLNVNYNSQIELVSHSHPQKRHTDEGQMLEIDLLWQAQTANLPPLTRFVHLVGPGGLQAQRDSAAQQGRYPTDHWAAGEYVRETVRLPIPNENSGGTYQLHVGWYDPNTGQRLDTAAGLTYVEITLLPNLWN